MLISIIIRTKDEEGHIGNVLKSISEQDTEHPYEIIVVDSGSTDKTLEIVEKHGAKIMRIPAAGFSYGHSLNYGIQQSSGEIICCLSAHCIPNDSKWLYELIKPLLDGKAHATYGRQIPLRGVNPFEEVFLQKHFPEVENRSGRVSFSNANCAFIRRMWDEVKFDERIPSWEDYLWYLLTKDTFLFHYVPNARVTHTHPFVIKRITKTAYRDGKAFRYMKDTYNFDILGDTASFIGKVRFAIKDLVNHIAFFLKEGYSGYLPMLPFVKAYSYLTYWRGYHSRAGTDTGSGKVLATVSRQHIEKEQVCTVSSIIPNWNHRQLLHECISSIYCAMGNMSHEIIVVDNASTDDSAEYIKKIFPEVIWVQNDTNRGYAKAVNQGVALSKGDFLFLLNNDVKLIGHTAERLISFLREHTDAGAVAPLLYYPDGRLQISCRRFPTPMAILMEKLHIHKIGPYMKLKLTPDEHLSCGEVQQPMASALMVRRECWDAVGPMDEGFPIFFNDVDWCYRLYKRTHYRIYILPEAKAFHHEGASIKRLGYSKKIKFYKGLIRFYRKHFPFSHGLPSA